MEDAGKVKNELLWEDDFDDDIYTDEVFSEFLERAKENLEKLSLNRNASATVSKANNADDEATKFTGGSKKDLPKPNGKSKSVLSPLKTASPSKAKKTHSISHPNQSNSSAITQDTEKTCGADENSSSILRSLQKIEKRLEDDFIGNRVIATRKLYKVFNVKIFDSKLPEDMELEWSVDLRTTAGKTSSVKKGDVYISCKIILSTKVLTTFERLRDTLLHEMCHAAVFLISQIHGEGHGPLWKTWAVRCKIVLPDIEMPTRCHSYDLSYPFYYQCSKCEWKVGRYRKSIKLSEACCPKCRSPLSLVKS